MARTSLSLGKGRVFSTMGWGSMPGIRIVSPFLNDFLPPLAAAIASTYSATVMYCDSVRWARATNCAVVRALAVYLIVPGGSSCVWAALPDAFAGGFCPAGARADLAAGARTPSWGVEKR